jgi:hypothetical protein
MNKYFVEYEVRRIGAFYWKAWELFHSTVEAENIDDALSKFRAKWGDVFEFRSFSQCYSIFQL